MARANLAAALKRADAETKTDQATTNEPQAPELAPVPTSVPAPKQEKPVKAAATATSTAPGPLYASLERKETRLREDQLAELATHARRLSRAKTVKGGERITDNTLIRIGIDLLLQKADDLSGNTEAELRKSVGL